MSNLNQGPAPDPVDDAAVEAATRAYNDWASDTPVNHRDSVYVWMQKAIAAYLDRSGLAEAESEIKAMFAETEQRLIAKVDALVAERDEARASLERAHRKIGEADSLLGPWGGTPAGTVGAIHNLISDHDKAVARAEAAERERDAYRDTANDADSMADQLMEARSAVARLGAQNAELRRALEEVWERTRQNHPHHGAAERAHHIAGRALSSPVDEAKARGFRHRPDSHRADHG